MASQSAYFFVGSRSLRISLQLFTLLVRLPTLEYKGFLGTICAERSCAGKNKKYEIKEPHLHYCIIENCQ